MYLLYFLRPSEGSFAPEKYLKVLKYSIEKLVLILITATETCTHTRTVLLKFVKYSECI